MCTIYIGMDIHKKFIYAVAMNGKGDILAEQRFGNDASDIKRFVLSFETSDLKVAIESTCTWVHVYEALESIGIDVTLVNVRRTKVIAESKIKTDRLDALAITQCLRTGFIAEAYVPSKSVRELRNIVRHRASVVREITRNKNRIHSILLRNGIKHEFSDLFGKEGIDFLRSLELKGSEKYRLNSYLNIVDSLRMEKKLVTKKIEGLCKANKYAMLLTTIPGIGYYSALVIVAEIGDVKRFLSPKKLCSYAGLVPRVIQSGNHIHHGKIIKECNQNLKWILNQCVHVHNTHCKSRISRLYYRIVRRKGEEAKNKATVAASRKMLTVIWHMLMRNEPFRE